MSIDGTPLEVDIDAHVHFFDKACGEWAGVWPWLGPTDSELLGDSWKAQGESYLPSNIEHENQWPRAKVGYIHVESAHGLEDPVEETRWLETLQKETDQPLGVVARVSLDSDRWRNDYEKHLESDLVKGVRDPVASRHLQSSDVKELLRELGKDQRIFEIYCRHAKFEALSDLATEHSETVIVVQHLGLPPVSSVEGMGSYWQELTALAQRPNVVLKISGIGLITQHDPSIEIVSVLQRAVEIFGSSRSMFGSDFPIERYQMSYEALVQIMTRALQPFSVDEQADVMGRTAQRVYAIQAEGSSQ